MPATIPEEEVDIAATPTRPNARQRRPSSLGSRPVGFIPPPPTLKRSISVPTLNVPPQVLRSLRRWVVCFALIKVGRANIPADDMLKLAGGCSSIWTRVPISTTCTLRARSVGQNGTTSHLPRSRTPRRRVISPSAGEYHGRPPKSPKGTEPPGLRLISSATSTSRKSATARTDAGTLKSRSSWSACVRFMGMVSSSQEAEQITHLSDFPGLFSSLMSQLGPLYMKHGSALLEASIHNIARWCGTLLLSLVLVLKVAAGLHRRLGRVQS